MFRNILFIIIFFPFSFSTCSKSFKLIDYQIGSNLNSKGEISNKSLIFKFNQFDKSKKYRNLFNFIYFEGDTICFSFEFSKNLSKEMINIWFINPKTKKRYTAERIDFIKNRVYGFSLAGSLLEYFFYNNLEKNLNPKEKTMTIPFELLIQIKNRNYKKKISSQFEIFY